MSDDNIDKFRRMLYAETEIRMKTGGQTYHKTLLQTYHETLLQTYHKTLLQTKGHGHRG